MYDKIPLMSKEIVKEKYAQLLREKLGEQSNWKISVAAFTPGIIVSPKDGATFQENGCGAIGRMYVLGVPKRENYKGMRGIGLTTDCDIRETEFYKMLTENKGYVGSLGKYSMKLERNLNTTEEVVAELKDLEKIVFQ